MSRAKRQTGSKTDAGEAAAHEGWGIAVTGHEFDLLDAESAFRAPFDPVLQRIEIHDQQAWVLVSGRFDGAERSTDVEPLGRALLLEVNGALALQFGAAPLKFDSVVEFSPNGPRRHFFMNVEDGFVIRTRMTGALDVTNADGSPKPPPPPSASRAQHWIKADGDDRVLELLTYAGRADNWYDIYKLIETAEAVHGSEHTLRKAYPAIKDAKRTANYFRHARAKGDRPPDQMIDIGEAKRQAFHAAKLALNGLPGELG